MLKTGVIKFTKETKSVSEFNCTIPDIQRTIDEDHVAAIYNYQLDIYAQLGMYIISGCVSIAVCDNIEYLIDGQHRLESYRRLIKNFPDRPLSICVDYYTCSDLNDVELLYKNVNTHKVNGITKLDIDPYKIITTLTKYLQTNFKPFLTTSANPRRPNINVEKVTDYITNNNIISRGNIKTPNELLERIQGLNTFYASIGAAQFVAWGIKSPDAIIRKIHELPTNLYFGLYTNYEWLERIVDNNLLDYNKMYHYSSTYRAPIAKALRIKVWNCSLMDSLCYCCGEKTKFVDFECGHVIPLTLGGQTNEENLRPICRQCNQDMSTRNLEEYKKTLLIQLG